MNRLPDAPLFGRLAETRWTWKPKRPADFITISGFENVDLALDSCPKSTCGNRTLEPICFVGSGAPLFGLLAEKNSANSLKHNTFETRFLLFKISSIHCARDEKPGMQKGVPKTL